MGKTVELVFELASRWFSYIIVIALAIAGKIGMDLMNGKRLSGWYVFGFTCVALFVCVMAALICVYKGFNPILTSIIGGASAMFSRDILVLCKMLNWKKISSLNWTEVFELLITKKKK